MKRAKLVYYCSECDTTIEKFIEFDGDQLPLSSIEKELTCKRTKKCVEMKLTKLGLPDNIKDNQQRLLG
jgi:hypothetical protein